MKLFALPVLAALMALPMQAAAAEEPDTAPTKGEQRLAKMLEGRVAGEPQNCMPNLRNAQLTVIDGTALVYKTGGTLYVNVPRDAEQLSDNDALVTSPTANRLCRTDIVRTI